MRSLRPNDPTQIGPYKIVAIIGKGGMSWVYLGVHEGNGRLAAVKLMDINLSDDVNGKVRFNHEITLARKVKGRRPVKILEANPFADEPWYASEFVIGRTLTEAIVDNGGIGLPENTVKIFALMMFEGLEEIHAAHIVHRDLKPSNVILSPDDGVRIYDFGIAYVKDQTRITGKNDIVGTAAFSSPEHLEGKDPTFADDIFALGCLLTYAATARVPFPGTDATVIYHAMRHREPVLTGVPQSLRPLIRQCLSKVTQRQNLEAIRPYLPRDVSSAIKGTSWLPVDVASGIDLVDEETRRLPALEIDTPTKKYTKLEERVDPEQNAPRRRPQSAAEIVAAQKAREQAQREAENRKVVFVPAKPVTPTKPAVSSPSRDEIFARLGEQMRTRQQAAKITEEPKPRVPAAKPAQPRERSVRKNYPDVKKNIKRSWTVALLCIAGLAGLIYGPPVVDKVQLEIARHRKLDPPLPTFTAAKSFKALDVDKADREYVTVKSVVQDGYRLTVTVEAHPGYLGVIPGPGWCIVTKGKQWSGVAPMQGELQSQNDEVALTTFSVSMLAPGKYYLTTQCEAPFRDQGVLLGTANVPMLAFVQNTDYGGLAAVRHAYRVGPDVKVTVAVEQYLGVIPCVVSSSATGRSVKPRTDELEAKKNETFMVLIFKDLPPGQTLSMTCSGTKGSGALKLP